VALITIAATDDLCAFLSAVSAGDFVFATTEADYTQANLCDIGTQIIATDENTNPDYKLLVIDPDDNCVKWMDQPPDPVYDSSLIKPLMLTKTTNHGSDTVGSTYTDQCKIDLVSADFPVAMKLLVTWTALARKPDGAIDRLQWKPRGVVGGVVADMVSGYIATHFLSQIHPPWVSSQYTAILDIPASPTGLYLAFDFITFDGPVSDGIQLSINAIAFKA
jgi:hypothetical protein